MRHDLWLPGERQQFATAGMQIEAPARGRQKCPPNGRLRYVQVEQPAQSFFVNGGGWPAE
jgi:hypothetical protein